MHITNPDLIDIQRISSIISYRTIIFEALLKK